MRWLTLSLEETISVFGPSGQPVYRKKCGNIGWKTNIMFYKLLFITMSKRFFLTLWWKVISRTWCSTIEKRQKRLTQMYHNVIFVAMAHNLNGEVVDRSWLCFSLSQTCVKCFTWRLMCADTTKCAHFLIRKGIFDWKHASWASE